MYTSYNHMDWKESSTLPVRIPLGLKQIRRHALNWSHYQCILTG